MIRFIPTLILSLGLFAANAQQSTTEQEFNRQLEAVSSRNKTIKCDFKQTKKVKNIKQPMVSTGKFYYDNSGSMALVYDQPQGDKIIMGGDRFTIISMGRKAVNEASSNPMLSQVSNMMRACMTGDVSRLGRGWNSAVSDTGKNYEVTLTPSDRRIQKYLAHMVLLFNKSDMSLDSLLMEESSGGYTLYEFSGKQFNKTLDSAVFNVD